MAPRTVLIVHSSSGRYGADRQLALIAGGLDPARYRPLVVLPEDGPLIADLAAAGVETLIGPVSVLRRELLTPRGVGGLLTATARDARGLGTLIGRRDVALVHSNTSVVLGGAAAAAAAGVPHVWHVREIFTRFGALWPPYRRLLERSAALPCVSRATAAQFAGAAPVTLLPDGLAVAAHRAPRAASRAALGLDGAVPVIAVLGRITDWKGQDVLIRALARPELRERGAIGLIAGEVWPGAEARRDAVVALARELGVLERLAFVGFRDDVETVYGAADLVAVPSTQPDPLPNSALEAAAAGCTVIAAAHGGLPDIIRDGETGRLVAPGDAAALAAAAAELLDDPPHSARLGDAAAADVAARFAPARLHRAVQALYDGVLENA